MLLWRDLSATVARRSRLNKIEGERALAKTVDADARSRWASHFGSFLEGLSEERLGAPTTQTLRASAMPTVIWTMSPTN
jgi:hypothetical protein